MNHHEISLLGAIFVWVIGFVIQRITERSFQTEKAKDLIPVKGKVVSCKAVHEDMLLNPSNIKILTHKTHNGYVVTYYPIVHFMLNNVKYEAVVDKPMTRRPVTDVDMDILVDVNNLEKVYEAAAEERSSLIVYLLEWGGILWLMVWGIGWLVRHSSLTI